LPKYGRFAPLPMPIKGPGTDAVFATYITPYEPSKPCQNTTMKVIFSDEGILKRRDLNEKRYKPSKRNWLGYPSLSKHLKNDTISCSILRQTGFECIEMT
jgi:hypothetical protein